MSGVAGVVLAAGEGRRLQPLTFERPKPLCPVGNEPLLDRAIAAVRRAVPAVAVNVHHGRAAMIEHLEGLVLPPRADASDEPDSDTAVHVSVEEPRALGTAGALGQLRPWLSGRAVLVVNADAWSAPDLTAFVEGWDHERVRILTCGDQPFGPSIPVVASLMPWSAIKALEPEPSGLYEHVWSAAAGAGTLETVAYDGPFVDCGTPRAYLEANLRAVAELGRAIVDASATVGPDAVVDASVIGAGAAVEGAVVASVVWPGASVVAPERLDHGIRTPLGRTVLVR